MMSYVPSQFSPLPISSAYSGLWDVANLSSPIGLRFTNGKVPSLILADGRKEVVNDITNQGKSVIIDKFFGFFHYYHQNQYSMFSWWDLAHPYSKFFATPQPPPPPGKLI